MAKTNIAFQNLRAEMARNNIAIKDMAKVVGVTRETMSNKLSRKTSINLDEAFLIVQNVFQVQIFGCYLRSSQRNPQSCNPPKQSA